LRAILEIELRLGGKEKGGGLRLGSSSRREEKKKGKEQKVPSVEYDNGGREEDTSQRRETLGTSNLRRQKGKREWPGLRFLFQVMEISRGGGSSSSPITHYKSDFLRGAPSLLWEEKKSDPRKMRMRTNSDIFLPGKL